MQRVYFPTVLLEIAVDLVLNSVEASRTMNVT